MIDKNVSESSKLCLTVLARVADDLVHVCYAVTAFVVCLHCDTERFVDAKGPTRHHVVPRVRILYYCHVFLSVFLI